MKFKQKRTFISIKGDMDDIIASKNSLIKKGAQLVKEYVEQAADEDRNNFEIRSNLEKMMNGFSQEDRNEILTQACIMLAKENA